MVHLPAEWSLQWGIILVWPHPDTDWAPWLKSVEQVYTEIANVILRFENLLIICKNKIHQHHIKNQLPPSSANQCLFLPLEYNDTWVRDFGPITLIDQNKAILYDFQFNAWGHKYSSHADNLFNQKLATCRFFKDSKFQHDNRVLEGGSIDTNGCGILLTTEKCLLSSQRNPGMTKAHWDAFFKSHFNIELVHWLTNGHLAGDDTDAHIDTLARFCNDTTIMYSICDESDNHYPTLSKMETELKQLCNLSGQPYQLASLPIPSPIYNTSDMRLPANYVNFLIINHAVLVPLYQTEADDFAIRQFQKHFPDREVIGVNCLPLIQQFGSLHCITMQLPKPITVKHYENNTTE